MTSGLEPGQRINAWSHFRFYSDLELRAQRSFFTFGIKKLIHLHSCFFNLTVAVIHRADLHSIVRC